jgi:ATP-binding cassette subfamily B protein
MSPFRRLLAYVLRYRQDYALGLLCVVATTSVALAAPRVLQHAIDDLTVGVTQEKFARYGGLLLAIGVIGGVFRFLMRRILIGASRQVEYDIRNAFFAHLERLPLAYFHGHRTGDLMSRATNDLNAVRMMVGPAVMYSANTGLGFAAALALMASIDPWLTAYALVPLPFVSISVKYFGSAIHKRFEQIQQQLSDVSAIAQEALAGVRVVRAYRQESAEIERFRAANAEYLKRNRRLIVLQGFFFPSMAFFLGLGAMIVLWFGSRAVVRGDITLGEFIAFNAYLTMLSWPMIAFGWVTNMLQRGMASWTRMLEVLDAPTANDGGSTGPAIEIKGDIEFRDLTFAFDRTPVLRHVSATIAAGQTVAIVGLTGSGKSTLIHLLARLYEPPRGTIFVDGHDVRDIPLSALRGAIGVVPQEPFLFSDTVAANVAFGWDATTRPPEGRAKAIEAAAAVARLDKDVLDFPKRYDTLVGERGITLSGGQKQRVAIARALAVDPRILILDDALSAVDTYTEEEILSRLRGVMRQRTAIIVSHRISTVRDANHILVLDEGRVVERGSHDELVRHGGLYAALHRKQLLEEELAAS